MTQRSITLGALAALFVLLTAGAASAQAGIVFEFGKHKKHSHVGVGIGIPLPGPTHHHVHTHYCRRYVPGHYDIVREQVWVPGCTHQIYVEAVYRTEFDHFGRAYQVLVTPAHYQTIQDQGRYDWVERKIWIPESWVMTCGY